MSDLFPEKKKISPPGQPTEEELGIFAKVEELIKDGWIYRGSVWLIGGWYNITLVRGDRENVVFKSKRPFSKSAYIENSKTVFFS